MVAQENIYWLKDVVNVRSWNVETYIKVHTSPVMAMTVTMTELYLAPNLQMCTLTKDIHYLCPSKPDNNGGICGLQPMTKDSHCPLTATPHYQVTTTQAEIVGRAVVNQYTKEGCHFDL